jgi:flagellar biosynthesis chaperone FliJ
LNKAISDSKIALASNELKEALDYFKKAEKNLYMAVDSQDDYGIRKHIKPKNI